MLVCLNFSNFEKNLELCNQLDTNKKHKNSNYNTLVLQQEWTLESSWTVENRLHKKFINSKFALKIAELPTCKSSSQFR